MENVKELRNEKCFIKIDDRNEIFGRDLTDMDNEPCFYNTGKRGVKKGWEALTQAFTPDMTMYQAMRFLSAQKVATRSYCAMD